MFDVNSEIQDVISFNQARNSPDLLLNNSINYELNVITFEVLISRINMD